MPAQLSQEVASGKSSPSVPQRRAAATDLHEQRGAASSQGHTAITGRLGSCPPQGCPPGHPFTRTITRGSGNGVRRIHNVFITHRAVANNDL